MWFCGLVVWTTLDTPILCDYAGLRESRTAEHRAWSVTQVAEANTIRLYKLVIAVLDAN